MSIETEFPVPLDRSVVLEKLKDYKRPNDKISEMIKSGELISLRRGLYIDGSQLDKIEIFLVANHLRGPSYVSLESALSYWGMIPERVFEVSSVTLKTSKTYRTALGRFSYHHQNAPYYSFGIKSIELAQNQFAMIASPEKALCDKIILTAGIQLKSIIQTFEFLIEDLRIEEDVLQRLNPEIIQNWVDDAPKKESLKMLIKSLRKL